MQLTEYGYARFSAGKTCTLETSVAANPSQFKLTRQKMIENFVAVKRKSMIMLWSCLGMTETRCGLRAEMGI
jgi:hypothetical protein